MDAVVASKTQRRRLRRKLHRTAGLPSSSLGGGASTSAAPAADGEWHWCAVGGPEGDRDDGSRPQQQRVLVVGETLLYRRLAAVTPAAGDVVADVGCSYGATSALLAGAVGSAGFVYGVDLSEECIGACTARHGPGGPAPLRNARFSRTDILDGDAAGAWARGSSGGGGCDAAQSPPPPPPPPPTNATQVFLDIGGNRGFVPVVGAMRACRALFPRLGLMVVKSKELRQFLMRVSAPVARDTISSYLTRGEEGAAAGTSLGEGAAAPEAVVAAVRRAVCARGGELPVSMLWVVAPRLRWEVGKGRLPSLVRAGAGADDLSMVTCEEGPAQFRLRIRSRQPPPAPPSPAGPVLGAGQPHGVREERDSVERALRMHLRRDFAARWVGSGRPAQPQAAAAAAAAALAVGDGGAVVASAGAKPFKHVFGKLRRRGKRLWQVLAPEPALFLQCVDATLDARRPAPWSEAWQSVAAMRHLAAFLQRQPGVSMHPGPLEEGALSTRTMQTSTDAAAAARVPTAALRGLAQAAPLLPALAQCSVAALCDSYVVYDPAKDSLLEPDKDADAEAKPTASGRVVPCQGVTQVSAYEEVRLEVIKGRWRKSSGDSGGGGGGGDYAGERESSRRCSKKVDPGDRGGVVTERGRVAGSRSEDHEEEAVSAAVEVAAAEAAVATSHHPQHDDDDVQLEAFTLAGTWTLRVERPQMQTQPTI
jgi:SAM-dependent methyltransferase